MIHLILSLTRQGLYIVKDDYFRNIMSKLHFFVEYVFFWERKQLRWKTCGGLSSMQNLSEKCTQCRAIRGRRGPIWLAKVDPLVVEDI